MKINLFWFLSEIWNSRKFHTVSTSAPLCAENIQLLVKFNRLVFRDAWCDRENGTCLAVTQVFKFCNTTGLTNVLHTVPKENVHRIKFGDLGGQASCQSGPNQRPRKCESKKRFTETNQCGESTSCWNTMFFAAPVHINDQCSSKRKKYPVLWWCMWLHSDLQLRSVCLIVSHDMWLFRASYQGLWLFIRQDW